MKSSVSAVYYALRRHDERVDGIVLMRALKVVLDDDDSDKMLAFLRLCSLQGIGGCEDHDEDVTEPTDITEPVVDKRRKLTAQDVLEIRAEVADGGSVGEISIRYGIDRAALVRAIKGQSWKRVKEGVG